MNNNDRLTGIIVDKNCNSIVTACNKTFLHYSGLKSFDNAVGHTDYDFSWAEYADLYRQHELDAIAGNNYSTIIPLKCYDDNVPLFLHNKIQNKDEQGHVIGIKVHAIEIINQSVQQLIYNLSQHSRFDTKRFCIGNSNTEIILSSRLQEVLFYLLRGKTAKEIGKMLGLSYRTVETHINNLKTKFNCLSKNALIECAVNANFIEMIPVSLSAKLLY